MKKIYIAAKFARRLDMRPIADRLWNLGFEIVSSWLNEVKKPDWMTEEEFYKKTAIKDLCEVSKADIFLLDTAVASETGGKENEFGFALGHWHQKAIYIVGPARSVFHSLADKVFTDWESCIDFLTKLPSPEQLAYTAGLIDGEGCITLTRASNGRHTWKPLVTVGMTDKTGIDFLRSLFPGSSA